MITAPISHFDREITIGELLRSVPRTKVEAVLVKALGDYWQVVDTEGTVVLEPKGKSAAEAAVEPIAVSLCLDIETIGKLVAGSSGASERIEAAAAWLELVLAGARRYRMASELHLEAVDADYQALQREHAALQESEARYRELSAQLEQRVKAQVEVIERTQRQLYQAEKLASVGSLAAGMAHEINNPIGFIRSNLITAIGYVDMMRVVLNAYRSNDANGATSAWQKADMDFLLEDFPTLLSESASGADRVARIVANLKDFSSIDNISAAAADLNESVRAVAGIVKDQIREDVALTMELQPLPMIVCDQGRINQALLALVQNALQAVHGRGQVCLSTRVVDGEIRIAVADNGCGIASDILGRIFDPFFTTQDVGKGTGLGLTVSRDIAAAHGGRIDVESHIGSGSTFMICLPVAGGQVTRHD